MEAIVVILLLVLIAILIMPLVALVKASGARSRVEDVAAQIGAVEIELRRLRQTGGTSEARLEDLVRQVAALQLELQLIKRAGGQAASVEPPVVTPAQAEAGKAAVLEQENEKGKEQEQCGLEGAALSMQGGESKSCSGEWKRQRAALQSEGEQQEPGGLPASSPVPVEAVPPQPPPLVESLRLVRDLPKEEAMPARNEIPSPQPSPEAVEPPSTEPGVQINWEQFMGAKLFAWIGGLAMFLGVAFFIKYSFEHNLVPPQVRAAIGFLIGVGLLVGGRVMKRKETAVTAQTLCSTGVLVLYGVTFACRALYHFAFFDTVPTFLLMTLITAVAFLLSVEMNAMVVAVLGIAGGFLTPVLLSTGQDAPLALFGYIALLDIGLLAVALRKEWKTLPVLGAIGTVLMQIGWIAKFFVPEKYFEDNKVLVAMAVLFGFQMLFLAAVVWGKRTSRLSRTLCGGAILLGGVAMLATFFFLQFDPLAQRPALIFGYVLFVDLGLLALAFLDEESAPAHSLAGVAAFLLLALWTGDHLTQSHLHVALACYLGFALLHSAAPLVLSRLCGRAIPGWCSSVPAVALVLVLMPIFKLTELSLLIWPLVLVIDLLAVFIAVVTAALWPILVVMALTLFATGAWIFRIPSELTGLPTSLFMLGGFALFFIAAATWASRKLMKHFSDLETPDTPSLFGDVSQAANLAVQIPALSATMPFLLLIMVSLRLPLANPSPVFGLALLLVVLLLGLAKIMALEALPAIGLVCVVALEQTWQLGHFNPVHAGLPLAWFLIFYGIFTVFPFVFHRQFAKSTLPWATAALAGPAHFYLLHHLVQTSYPAWSGMMGLMPAAFSIPALLGVVVLLKITPAESPARNTQLAWFGGVTLFFITLIFPIQFDRQWITIGWALEGAALCWLFQRVPHPGVRLTGVVLLVVAFVRLALNSAVLSYHARAAAPILNWYLYAYGVTVLCLFGAARLLAPPRNEVAGFNTPPLLCTLGTILSFLLVNIEIADFFSVAGAPVLTFQFSGDFASDMTYSIAWALFALLLLVIGIAKRLAPVRYASIGLFVVTLLKLFFHDLSQLDQLYRIAAFIVVAVIAMLASFLYQRFFGTLNKLNETDPAP